MIARFRHKGLERFFRTGVTSGINAQHARRIGQILGMLNVVDRPQDMALPGYRLHRLRGDRSGQWAVWVSGNWRIVFEFDGDNAVNVDLADYH